MKILIALAVVAFIFALAYSLCRAAGEADDRSEELFWKMIQEKENNNSLDNDSKATI